MSRRREKWACTGPADPITEMVVRLANELGESPEKIAAQLDEAQDAGLIIVTDQGEIIPTLPPGAEQ